jgi:acyl transferase domain-containing protein
VGSLRRGQDTRAVMLESLAALWVQGGTVAWRGLVPAGRRVALPTYPWQRERHWIEAADPGADGASAAMLALLDATDGADFAEQLGLSAGSDADLLDRVLSALRARSGEDRSGAAVRGWMYTLAWRTLPRPAAATASGRWVVLVDAGGVGDRVADALEAAGTTCARIRVGPAFERVATSSETWSVDTTSPANLAAWWSERLATWGPVRGVLHLWSLSEAPRSVADVDAALQLSVHTALAWIQALVRTDHRHRAKLWLATSGAVSVGADDPVRAPEHAPLWGLGRVVASERPDLWGGLMDLPRDPDADTVAAVVAELVAADGEDQVALRASSRYVPRIVRPVPVPAARPWSTSGTALITGGLGALGVHLARWLARRGVKHLVLVSRRGAATPGAAEAVASVTALGAAVTVARADVADFEAMAAVLADIDARWPPLSAVFHAAGVLDDGILERQDASRFATVLAPKVLGAWNLHVLTQQRSLATFVLFSSLASLLGSPGLGSYAAGNAFLDALAQARRAAGLAGQSVNWGAWRDGGMASRKLLEEAERRGARAMRPGAALAALSRVLAEGHAQVAVADTDWSRAHTHFEGSRRLTSEMAGRPRAPRSRIAPSPGSRSSCCARAPSRPVRSASRTTSDGWSRTSSGCTRSPAITTSSSWGWTR